MFMSEDDKQKDWAKIKAESEKLEEVIPPTEPENPVEGILDHPSYVALEEKLTLAEKQAHENWEKSVRALAELENVRRRADKDVSNAVRFGMEKMVTALLPIKDSLEHALQIANKQAEPTMMEGLELVVKLFTDTLEKFEVKEINPEGALFDPHTHEAMSMQEAPDVPPNTVLTVFQKGYSLSGRIIRPARVVVSKK
jgi:molecular chaperone GrpE